MRCSASASGGKAMGGGIEKRAVSTVDDAKRKRGRKYRETDQDFQEETAMG